MQTFIECPKCGCKELRMTYSSDIADNGNMYEYYKCECGITFMVDYVIEE